MNPEIQMFTMAAGGIALVLNALMAYALVVVR